MQRRRECEDGGGEEGGEGAEGRGDEGGEGGREEGGGAAGSSVRSWRLAAGVAGEAH